MKRLVDKNQIPIQTNVNHTNNSDLKNLNSHKRKKIYSSIKIIFQAIYLYKF